MPAIHAVNVRRRRPRWRVGVHSRKDGEQHARVAAEGLQSEAVADRLLDALLGVKARGRHSGARRPGARDLRLDLIRERDAAQAELDALEVLAAERVPEVRFERLAIASCARASVWPVLTSLTLPVTAWLAFCTHWQVLLSCSQRYRPIASRSALLTHPLSPSYGCWPSKVRTPKRR
jgi:hypothetical protein